MAHPGATAHKRTERGYSAAECAERLWDVVIIGSGMGGGLVGRTLAERGLSVLFLERGGSGPALDGADEATEAGLLVDAAIDGQPSMPFGRAANAVGGSTVTYAAALERPERHDLDDSPERRHPTGGWPVGYDAFEPYFAEVQALFDVCGTPDPLNPSRPATLREPPLLCAAEAEWVAKLQKQRLHPYRAHIGIRFLPGCRECIGRACASGCKPDSATVGVLPALRSGRAALVTGCTVTALRGSSQRIDFIEARVDGQLLRFIGRRVVLAAGALGSAQLLLSSSCEAWPRGCANGSGMVGRNLMFHLSERVAVWPSLRTRPAWPAKTIALRDFYFRGGARYGIFQSMGLEAGYGNLVEQIRRRFDELAPLGLRPMRPLLRAPALAVSRALGPARIFVGILEDLPYEFNRVLATERAETRVAFEYRFAEELLERRASFRRIIRDAVGRGRSFFLSHVPELNLTHACGTARFGTDPATSVLDPSCRTHEIDNLLVVDASFMPTSCGVGPSLIVAANALRVAEGLLQTRAEG